MPRVMISYRNLPAQRAFAVNLEKALANAGVETWLDVKDIPRLSRWEDEIFKGIIGSDYVVLCLSPEYFASETCLFECHVARGYGRKILPIIVPYDGTASVFPLINQYEQTRSIDDLNFVSFHTKETLGLLEDDTLLMQRLIKAIITPTPLDINYDVYFSFRWTQAAFATQIADDFNRAGIKAFIHTRSIDAGADWRRASWSAALRARIHAVILSPDVAQSQYIDPEVLISRTRPDLQFIPILAKAFVNDEQAKSTIRTSFNNSKNLSVLNAIQWVTPYDPHQDFIDGLIKDVKTILNQPRVSGAQQ
ncbi:MAG: toll/interleukin-1 receptor domain-containing protein [Chloroflexi bacterium]|nr:toll/interleukin-1 receptor domain-containing protein [Chloroflexota bacterium]